MLLIIEILLFLLTILTWLVIAQCILGLLFAFNVLNFSNSGLRSLLNGLDRFLEPLYRPFRRFVPAAGNIDWSPFLLLVLIGIVRIVLGHVAVSTIA